MTLFLSLLEVGAYGKNKSDEVGQAACADGRPLNHAHQTDHEAIHRSNQRFAHLLRLLLLARGSIFSHPRALTIRLKEFVSFKFLLQKHNQVQNPGLLSDYAGGLLGVENEVLNHLAVRITAGVDLSYV